MNATKRGERYPEAARVVEDRTEEILEGYLRDLRASGNPLVAEARMIGRVAEQARAVLRDTARVLRGGEPSVEAPPGALGKAAAVAGVHPSENLRAVSALSGAALRVVARSLPNSSASSRDVAEISLAIQSSMMERVAQASVSYRDHLLDEALDTRADERRRIGRDLQGRVAPPMTAVLQGLELHELFQARGDSRARGGLGLARTAAREALRRVREVSEELGQGPTLGERLEVSILEILSARVPQSVDTRLSLEGDERFVPLGVRNELMLILGEGVRSAGALPGVGEVKIRLQASRSRVRAQIKHDGRCVDSAVPPEALAALASARERASLLGGGLEVTHVHDGGVLELEIPLARGAAREGRAARPAGDFARVVLADGHDLFRRGISEMLAADEESMEVVGEAANDDEAVEVTAKEKPDLLLLDLDLPVLGAREVIKRVAVASPDTRVIVLAVSGDSALAHEFLSLGASAYMVKGASREEMVATIHAAARGENSIILSVPHSKPSSSPSVDGRLSRRQVEVLRLAARGMSNKQISLSLHISERTVKRHLADIYAGLGVGSRREAVEKLLAAGPTG